MKQVILNNANGYMALETYPFPRKVAIVDSFSNEFSLKHGAGLIEIKVSAIVAAARDWKVPDYLQDMADDGETIHISSGHHFEEAGRDGWTAIDDGPFAFWNMLKASRRVGAGW